MSFTFHEPFDQQDPNCVASFNRTFEHTDWIDGESVVQAGSEDGFNVRFHKITQDLDALAADARQGLECTAAMRASLFAVISEAQAELARLGTPAPTLTFTPTMVSFSDRWDHFDGGAEAPADPGSASGMMSVSLPAGATLRQFRATGANPDGNLDIVLVRQQLDVESSPDPIVTLTAPNSSHFDEQSDVPSDKAKIDNERFRYYIRAQLDGASQTVQLSCFQITIS